MFHFPNGTAPLEVESCEMETWQLPKSDFVTERGFDILEGYLMMQAPIFLNFGLQ